MKMKTTVLLLSFAAAAAMPVGLAQAQTYQQEEHMTGQDESGFAPSYNYGRYGYSNGYRAYGYAYRPYYRRQPPAYRYGW